MNCFYLLFTITILIAQVFAEGGYPLCTAIHGCINNPYKAAQGKYIGFIQEDCSNIYICEKYDQNACAHVDNMGRCLSTGMYFNCYDQDGTYINWLIGQDTSYLNPWVYTKFCDNKSATVNARDSNCYKGAKGNQVLFSNMKKREAKYATKKNGRCLVGAGWCPC